MNVGPVYHPIPPGADLITQISYHLEHLSTRTEGSIHFLFVAVPPAITLLCLGLARVIPLAPARLTLRFLAVAAPILALRPFFHSTWVLAPWQFGIFLVPLALLFRQRVLPLRSRAYRALVASTFALALLPFLNIGFTFNRLHDCERVENDPRVHAIFSLCKTDWKPLFSNLLDVRQEDLAPFSESRAVFVSANGRTAFASFGYEDESQPHVFLAIDRATGEIRHAEVTHTVFRGACPSSILQCFTVHPFESGLRVLDPSTFAWGRNVPLPFKPRFFTLTPSESAIFFVGAPSGQIATVDPSSFKLRDYSVPGPLWVPPSAIVYDSKHDRLYSVGEFHTRQFIKVAQGPDYHVQGIAAPWMDYVTHLGTSVGLALDTEQGELYVGMTFTGDVLVIDTDTLEEKARFRLEPGLRELTYDAGRQRLYAGNYLSGVVHEVDAPARREIGRLFIGRRIRNLTYDPRIDRVLATSANGFFELTPR